MIRVEEGKQYTANVIFVRRGSIIESATIDEIKAIEQEKKLYSKSRKTLYFHSFSLLLGLVVIVGISLLIQQLKSSDFATDDVQSTENETQSNTTLAQGVLFLRTDQTEYRTLTYPDGGRYEGEILDGQRHGKGIYSYPNGSVYTGEWQHGKKQGWGLYKWPSGNRYEGEWQNNQRHGKGTLVFADGGIYEGMWVNGKSQGTLTEPDR